MRLAVIEPTPFGGLLHYATQLADALAERGNEVELVVTRDQELADREGAAHRRPILSPAGTRTAGPSPLEALRRRGRTAVRLAGTWTRIAREVRLGRYDAVILNGSLDLALTAGAALAVTATKGATPLAHVCHNVRPFNRWGGDDLYVSSRPTLELLRRAYPSFDLLFVHGERSLREYHETWPATRLAVIPHGDEGIFADEPPPPATEPRILFFGAWRKMKGLPVLMEAFDRLSAERPDARLTIAGPTVPEEGEADRVLRWAAERADRVEVRPGYVAVEDVPDLFAAARVVALPYRAGYQSGVVHLAMTMERAVVATDVGDLGAAVADGETGTVVAPNDPTALAAALGAVLDDPALAARMGAAGRARLADRAGWPRVADRVETALRDLTETETPLEEPA
jgi:glycosyltransferase involved in cell wall biosynthesis